MQAQKFIDQLYIAAEKAGIKEFQMIYNRVSSSSLSVFESKIQEVCNDENQGLSFQVKIGGKIGKFHCDALEEESIPLMIKGAEENALLIDDKDDNFFFDGQAEYQKVKPYSKLAEPLSKLDKMEFLLDLERKAYAKSNLINKVIDVYYSEDEGELIMRNSLGLNLRKEWDRAVAGIRLSAQSGEVIKDAGKMVDFSKESDFDADWLVDKAVEKAIAKISPIESETGKIPVVIDGKTFRLFVTKIAEAISAKMIDSKYSKFVGKIGQQVASKAFTLIEDPFLEGGIGTKAFDGEGYPTSYKEVIKNGVLQTYFHNLKTAYKDNVKPTGNGSGGDSTMVSNLYLQPGKTSYDELISELGEGILIDKLSGVHVGFSLISGDFSFVGEGFEVKNGKIGRALSNFTVSGNFYQMLKDIRQIGSDLDFDLSRIGAPSVIVDNLTIAGK